MTKKTLKELEEGIKKIKELRKIESSVKVVVGLLEGRNSDGLAFATLSKIETDYIWFLGKMFDDEFDWISYFVYDCELGTDAKTVTTKEGKKIKVDSVKKLYWLLTHKI